MEAIRAVEITHPVIRDAKLRRALRRLFTRLESWSTGRRPEDVARLACEESLVETCVLLLAHHRTVSTSRALPADVTQVHDLLADNPLHAPTL